MIKLVTRLTFISVLFVFCTPGFALSLGEKQLNSVLDQKLDARVELLSARRDEAASMAVTLAADSIYQRMNLERSPILEKLIFSVQRNEAGKYYIHITSEFIISKPFLSFLVELNWNNGRLLREFTLFMDPPMFLDENLDTLNIVAQPQAELLAKFSVTTGEKFDDVGMADLPTEIEKYEVDQFQSDLLESGLTAKILNPVNIASLSNEKNHVAKKPLVNANIKPVVQVDKAKIVKSPAVANKVPSPTSLVYSKVKKNEILWRIADKMRPGNVTVEQMMIALHNENPEAFSGGNLSSLKAGSVLRIRDVSTLTKVSAKEAKFVVERQNEVWLASKKNEKSIPIALVQQKEKLNITTKEVVANKTPVSSKPEIALALEPGAERRFEPGLEPETEFTPEQQVNPVENYENSSLIVMAKPVKPIINVITLDMLLADKKLLGLVMFSILLLTILAGWLINRVFYHKYYMRKHLKNPLDKPTRQQNENPNIKTTVVQFDEIVRKNIDSEYISSRKQSATVNS